MTEWIMVWITLVYVIATIFICYYNYKSSKATREQIIEMKRQFEETNRAFVSASLSIVRNGLIALCIANHGQRIAYNVKVDINKEFINSLPIEDQEVMLKISGSSFSIGIGQQWYMSLGSHVNMKRLASEIMKLHVEYHDNDQIIKDYFELKFGEYSWALIYDSPTSDIYKEIKKQTVNLDHIDRSLAEIASRDLNTHKNHK